ncbi:FAD-dependent oxidoreductase [Bradyrhizobium sp. NP1]|uniref:NAD(P)/FAD-dependent oxidoreductase n=1 Tax=Bradyrhizobium sp. NP1 TaxID=3049772 RepID=UPI0025A66E57|nr:FAD-dependent oxidoreductase [Bradyrhizobium sp. NP1]WJR80323.1 FAD-dependent oxidoreductase [Bradyrhizobium sp. NP1]
MHLPVHTINPQRAEHRPFSRLVVVGGGIAGITAALALLKRGLQVVVVDEGIAEKRCSFGNAGSLSPGSVAPLAMPGVLAQVPGMLLDPKAPLHIRASYILQAAPWLWRFVREASPARVQEISLGLSALLGTSIELYTGLLAEIGGTDLIRRRGQLQLYADEHSFRKDQAVWALRRARGVTVEDVNADDIRQLEPSIGKRYSFGVYLPNEGMITNPAGLVDRLTEVFVRRGGEVINAKVVAFDIGPERPRALLTNSGPVTGDAFVIAAGAWSTRLTRQIGDDLPLQTQRGYHITVHKPNVELSRPVVAADRKYFVTPMDIGLRIAGTVEFDSLDSAPNYARARALIANVPELLPDLKVGIDESIWMGHRPCMPDSLPVIDRASRFNNVFYAFGNGHLGLTGAPMTAELIAALVTGSKPAIDISPFRVSRF